MNPSNIPSQSSASIHHEQSVSTAYSFQTNIHQSNHTSADQNEQSTLLQSRIAQYKLKNYDMLEFQQLKHALFQDNIDAIYYGIIGVRKLISKEEEIEYTIDLYFNSEIVQRIVDYAIQNQHFQLKKQSLSILSHLAYGTQQQVSKLIKMGIISLFFEGLVSTDPQLVESCLLGVDNLILDNSQVRDTLLENKIIHYLLPMIQNRPTVHLANKSIITVCNLIRVKPVRVQIENIELIVAYFCWYMKESEDQLRDGSIIWAFTHLTHNNQSMVKLLIESEILETLVNIAKNCSQELKHPTLKIIHQILAKSNSQTIVKIAVKITTILEQFIENNQDNIRSQVYQIATLIGSIKQTQQLVYSNQTLMTKLWKRLIQKTESEHNFRNIGNLFMRPLFQYKIYNDAHRYTSAVFYRQAELLRVIMEYIQIFKSPYCLIDCLSWIEMLLVAGKKYSRVGVWIEHNQFLENHGDKIINDLEKATTNETIKKLINSIRMV